MATGVTLTLLKLGVFLEIKIPSSHIPVLISVSEKNSPFSSRYLLGAARDSLHF